MRAEATTRAALLVAVALVLASRADIGAPDSPNVILISMDTLRADHLGAYGYRPPTSPCLDRLARRSIVFEQAFSHATWTLPSHMSLFTSLHPHQHGVLTQRDRLGPRHRTLAEVLRDAGYATAAFTAGFTLSQRHGFDRGFGVYREEYPRRAPVINGKGYCLRDVLPDALAWLDAHARERLFVFLHAFDVHEPFVAHEHLAEFESGYDGPLIDVGNPPSFAESELRRRYADGRAAFNVNDFFSEVLNRGRLTLSDADRRHVIALYDNEIRAADEQICALVDHLERAGLARRTIVVLTSDHGQELFERGSVQHGGPPYDQLIHVPLIVYVPARYGTRSRKLARHIDVAPTVLALLGLPPVAEFEGLSLLPLTAAGAESVVSTGADVTSIRTAERKLMRRERETSLYDLVDDPGEQRNVAAVDVGEAEHLRASLDRALARRPAPSIARGADALTETQRSQLKALGYAE